MNQKLIKLFISDLKNHIAQLSVNEELSYSLFNRFLFEKYIKSKDLYEVYDYLKKNIPELFYESIDFYYKNISNFEVDLSLFEDITIFDICFQHYNSCRKKYVEKTQFYTPQKIVEKICTKDVLKDKKSILEPSAGSGIFLREIYRKSKELNMTFEISAYEIDKRAIQLAKISFILFAYEKYKDFSFVEIENKDFMYEEITNSFDLVVSNPPFLGRKDMPKEYMRYLKDNYPLASENMAYAFLLKALRLLNTKGVAMFIIPSNFLYLQNTKEMKTFLEEKYLISFENNIKTYFSDIKGSKMQPCILKVEKNKAGIYKKREDKRRILSDIATVVTGIQTGNNKKYVKHFSEIPLKDRAKGIDQKSKKWYPYLKGGGYKKWSGNDDFFIYYENNGEILRKEKNSIIRNEKYFYKEGITYSYYCENRFSARYKEKGCLFDIGGSCLFFKNKTDLYYTLALLNSSVGNFILQKMNPTMSVQTFTIKNFPLIIENKEKIASLSKKAVNISKNKDKLLISSKYFEKPDFINYNEESFEEAFLKSEENFLNSKNELENIEQKINKEFEKIYGLKAINYYIPKQKNKKQIRKMLIQNFLKWLKPKNYNDVLAYVKSNYPKTFKEDLLFISKSLNGKYFKNIKEVIEKVI